MKCIRKAETVDRRNNVEIILAFFVNYVFYMFDRLSAL